MDDDAQRWFGEFQTFLKTMRSAVSRKCKLIEPNQQRVERVTELGTIFDTVLKDVEQRLAKEDEKSEILSAVGDGVGKGGNKLVIDVILREMAYVAKLVEGARSEKEADSAIESSKTVKDSIEKLFGLPTWLKKVLHLVNEILSLARLA